MSVDLNTNDVPQSSDVTFYLNAFGTSHKADFERAAGVQGLDAEIVMLRVAISALIERDPSDMPSIHPAILTLERLVRTRFRINRNDAEGLAERMATILGNIHLPPGITAASLQK